jgi:hypothetical protein
VKTCSKCKLNKSLADFRRCRTSKDGHKPQCAECQRLDGKRWKAENREKVRAQNKKDWRKWAYGLTNEQFSDMFQSQQGRCSICQTVMVKPNVDHCHKTGRVRELLCNGCNAGIGIFDESVERLQAAIAYLRKFGG